MLRLALSDLGFDRLRTALSIAGMAAVVVCALLLGALAGALSDFLAAPPASRTLIIIDGNYIDPGDSTLPSGVLIAAQSLQPQFVSRASPMFFRHLRINERLVQLRAAPLEDWSGVYHLSLQAGRWPHNAAEVAVGEGLVASAGWSLGSELLI